MGLSPQGYKLAENDNHVYLLHSSLNGSLARISKSESEKVANLTAFVKQHH